MNEKSAGRIWEARIVSELIVHVAFLVAATAVIVLSFTMTLVGWTSVYLPGSWIPLPESCTARLLFGLNCPGCGMTRAFISISHGEFQKAWQFNPASFAVYLFVCAQLPWQSWQISHLFRRKRCVESLWIYAPPIAVAVLMITQWLFRMSTQLL